MNITASQARALNPEFDSIESKIRKAALKGKHEVTIKTLSKSAKAELLARDFILNSYAVEFDKDVTITW